ncbi:hypothetical protein C5167_021351 [Papaver somniferum]|uniref:RNase H type-1 domain-containing protein n=1 Tax=Papaver somniferum TaxID=3469 RepID=A0A4Y7IWB2_PAPSO|nr:hypothetical protein C5167_021351 [Papaver somniferum]
MKSVFRPFTTPACIYGVNVALAGNAELLSEPCLKGGLEHFRVPINILDEDQKLAIASGCGIVLLRSNGDFAAAKCWTTSVDSVIEAEAKALLAAIEWASQLQLENLLFIADYLSLVQADHLETVHISLDKLSQQGSVNSI